MDAYIIIFVLANIAAGVISAIIADAKGANATGWFFLGLVFGLLAILAVAVKPSEQVQPLEDEIRKCPFCAESIRREAIVCRYCGRDVEPIIDKVESAETQAFDETSIDAQLIDAASAGDEARCLTLLRAGADPTATDASGFSAADHSRGRGYEKVHRLLMEHAKTASS